MFAGEENGSSRAFRFCDAQGAGNHAAAKTKGSELWGSPDGADLNAVQMPGIYVASGYESVPVAKDEQNSAPLRSDNVFSAGGEQIRMFALPKCFDAIRFAPVGEDIKIIAARSTSRYHSGP